MSIDLVVPERASVVLTDEPADSLRDQMKRLNILTLNDLAEQQIVGSTATLDRMLTAAKRVTQEALSRRETYTPFRPIRGTIRTDLQRFGGFLAAVPSEHPIEIQTFWLIARSIEPTRLQKLETNTPLQSLVDSGTRLAISRFVAYNFNNITVQPGATLEIQSTVKVLRAHELLIKRTGRIVVKGTGTTIKAFSIQGEQ